MDEIIKNHDRARTASYLKELSDEYTIAARARYDLKQSHILVELFSTENEERSGKIRIPNNVAVEVAYQTFLDELIRYYENQIEKTTAEIRHRNQPATTNSIADDSAESEE